MASLRTRFENRKRTPWTLFRNFLFLLVFLSVVYIVGNIVRGA